MVEAQVGGGPASPNFNIGIEGWDPFQFFSATTNTDDTSSEFVQGAAFCVSTGCTSDPLINLNTGGDATQVGQTFSFTADEDGGGSFNFVNTGTPITNILVTTLTDDEQGKAFTCSSDIFAFCGFKDPDSTLEIFFSNPVDPSGIPTNITPEPAQYAWLLLGFSVVVVTHQIRSRRAKRILLRAELS
ncbi:MAG: hypothetical protein JOZ32_06970 [Bryobacterales bacterium]|nr:hypothetical protein [Bryobacterales bacterium]